MTKRFCFVNSIEKELKNQLFDSQRAAESCINKNIHRFKSINIIFCILFTNFIKKFYHIKMRVIEYADVIYPKIASDTCRHLSIYYGCAVRSLVIGVHLTSSPCNKFFRYPQWLDIFLLETVTTYTRCVWKVSLI